ncbi:Proteinase inhibitor [Parasponia andersonii]|uniref:Proteinase inhibitor n=1 Tax=Parasponia andersonii TaxID=3476 RepID=A0A2P5BWT4_PARAD|nr:Proteinase inhibitor [Parasponia andersonii]
MSSDCQGKQSWPELVGVRGEVAEATIERENPAVNAVIVPERSIGDTQFRCDRVRVRVDDNGIVSSVPRVG